VARTVAINAESLMPNPALATTVKSGLPAAYFQPIGRPAFSFSSHFINGA
jgi:hypothetical protein